MIEHSTSTLAPQDPDLQRMAANTHGEEDERRMKKTKGPSKVNHEKMKEKKNEKNERKKNEKDKNRTEQNKKKRKIKKEEKKKRRRKEVM